MDNDQTTDSSWMFDPDIIGENGERVSHLHNDHVYYGHLSIYHFALQYCMGGQVLDAGSGAGYGADYLADKGAEFVLGIDLNEKAIEFSKFHFPRPNLDFKRMGVEEISGLLPQRFDLIFTSNTLEHVPNVKDFLRGSWYLLKPKGVLLVAVPPITDDRLLYLNLINQYHVNLWSPRQWQFALSKYYQDVTPFLHGVGAIGRDFTSELLGSNTKVTERSFVFAPGIVEDMYTMFTLTAIFIVRNPLPERNLPPVDSPMEFVDESFTRPPGFIDPRLRKKLSVYFEHPNTSYSYFAKAMEVLKDQGFVSFFYRIVVNILRRIGYIDS
ncbi:class I SAM-dependent methyltransferase [bacterium]|nr:class I SAM-dependent methyltransferase [bacterium]